MNFFQKISAVWQNISLVQRALLTAIVLTFIIAGVLLTYWARRPDMRMLYQDLAPEEASKITEKISEKDIAYELRNGGTSVYVPKEKVYQLRLDMAKEGLPVGEQGGYKIFDNEKIGISPFVQNVNLKRALQEELAKSIQMIDGVVHARVHIVSPKETVFAAQAGETSASVVLRLRAGHRLSNLNIAAITHLVAGSVSGLKSENVTVIDSQGRLLSCESDQTMASGASTVADYKERVEQNLSQKIEEMLTTILGPGRASVKVSAVIDMISINTITETPIKGMPKKEEIKSGSETKPGTAGGENEQAIPGGTKKEETITTEFEHGRRREQKVVLPGEITSLKVAAVVDLSPAVGDANETEAGAEAAKIMELDDVEKLIRNALGLQETDALTVVDAKFHRPLELLVDEEPSKWPSYIAIARQASLGVMAICALLVLKVFSGASKKAGSAAARGQLAGGEGAAGLLPAGAGGSERLTMRKQIADTLQSNPEQAKQLFTSWLEEKGE
jgi:flagellar M-ring protein FliF